MQLIPFTVHQQAKVSAADTEGVYSAVQFFKFQRSRLHVAISADALDPYLFAQQCQFHCFIAFGRADTDTDCSFHEDSLRFKIFMSIHPRQVSENNSDEHLRFSVWI